MKITFLRFYLLLLTSMIVLALAIEGLLANVDDESTPWLPAHHLFCSKIALPSCASLNAQMTYLPRHSIALPDRMQQRLQQGELLTIERDQQHALILAQVGEQLITYGPVLQPSAPNELALYLYLLFFGLFGLVLLFWLWPVFRDLDSVRHSLSSMDTRQRTLRFKLSPRSVMQPLTRVITQLSQQTNQLLQTQREMSHFIAHDLRTPLARMRFALAMLNTDQADLKKDLLDNIAELERTTTEYLRYADNEAQHVITELPLISVADFFAELEKSYRNSAKHLRFEYEPHATFHADAFSLQRALCNLIDNAERYAASTIVVRLRQRLHCCVLQVDDDGPGIPPPARQTFRQANTVPRVRGDREQGFGLGLYIVRRVAMLHRGHLKLLATAHGGARFEIVWPDAP